MFYEITDPEFIRKYAWSPPAIENFHCTEDVCRKQAACYLDDPAVGVPGFYCKVHRVLLTLRGAEDTRLTS